MDTVMNRFCRVVGNLICAIGILLLTWSHASAGDVIKCAYPYWFGFAPTHVAQDLGYFKEEGLEVTWVFEQSKLTILANFSPHLVTLH